MLLYDVHKKNEGFTLIEILTVVIIVGVLATVAAPNFLGMLNQTRVKDAQSQVEGAIRETQRIAMRRGKTCKIKFVTKTIDGESRQTINVVESTDSGETVAAGYYNNCLLEERVLPVGVSINGASSKIGFSGKGNTIEGDDTTIIVKHSGTNTEKCVRIEGILGNIVAGDYDATATVTCKAK